MLTAGVDVGGTKTAIGLFNESGELIKRSEFKTDASAGAREAAGAIADALSSLALAGVGVGLPSCVDHETGYVYSTTNIPGLADCPLGEFLAQKLGCRVCVDNDANCAALAEHRRGAGRGESSMIFSTVSTGIGGGIILDGRLIHGAGNSAGEIGHMLLSPGRGVLCGCGNRGCFESVCAGASIGKNAAARIAAGERTTLTPRSDGRELKTAFDAGDAVARDIVGNMADGLGILYYDLHTALGVPLFVLGGGLLSAFGEELLGRIRASFARYGGDAARIVPAQTDFGVIGAHELLE